MRYTAVSRSDGDRVVTGAAATAVASVVPPPEVYFVCLAFHVPSLAEVQALPGMSNPALRDMLARVFDFPIDADEQRHTGV